MLVTPHDPGPVALIGAGAVASALAAALLDAGYEVAAVLSRTPAPAQALARRVGAPLASADLADLPPHVRLVVLCVPDAAVEPLAGALAALPHPWRTTAVAHTAGALGTDVLAPLTHRGAAVFCFHPVQTFAPGAGAAAFHDIYIGLAGSPPAVAFGTAIADRLGARHVVIPDEARARYHLAASMASNFFVVLLALADEVLATTGIPRADARALVRPLVEATWANLRQGRPEDILTGPVARGDAGTVRAHLEALAEHLPHLVPTYGILAAEAVRVAARGGRIDGAAAEAVLGVVQAAVERPR